MCLHGIHIQFWLIMAQVMNLWLYSHWSKKGQAQILEIKLPCKTEVLEPSVPVKFNSVFWYWYSFWKGYSAVEVGLEHETAWSCLLCKYQSDAFYSCNFFSMVHWCWKECYCRALCIFFLFKQGRKFCHNDVPCHKFTLEEKGPCNLFYWLS